MFDLIVVGGGAAGYFGAISAAEAFRAAGLSAPRICILEQGRQVLTKVRVSGGGRCNVTHAEFDPKAFAAHYPRGRRELLGPLNRFGPGDTMAWFADRGLALKIEDDGRVFPVSNDSASVIEVLSKSVEKLGIEVRTSVKLLGFQRITLAKLLDEETRNSESIAGVAENVVGFELETSLGRLSAKQLLLATGSAPSIYQMLGELGIPIVAPVPSLFSFNLKAPALTELQGLSMPDASLKIEDLPYQTRGSLLITHWGLSGPAALKMSAAAAIELHQLQYQAQVLVSWIGSGFAETREYLRSTRVQSPKSTLRSDLALGLPKRLWAHLVERAGLLPDARWADLRAEQLDALARALTADTYPMHGQTRFKEEFVTAGGIELSAVDFRTFGIKGWTGLHAAGEVLNIDGVTGGFNFQAAWTGGYLAGKAIAETFVPKPKSKLKSA